MPKIAFTDLTVQSLTPGVYFDKKTPAFGLRVGKNRRTWIVLKGAKSTKVRLGHYPALSLAQARRKALVAIGSPYEPNLSPSFPDTRTEFLEQHASRLRPRSRNEITRTLNKHFTWTKPIDKITANDIATAVAEIYKPSEANHAFKDIRTFFNWCVPRYLKYSPCTGLKMPHKAPSRSRVLTDDELKAVWKAAEQSGTPGVIVKLLMLTGMRKGEASALLSEWICNDQITLPKEITKNGREFTLPIGAFCAGILSQAQKNTQPTNGYIFCSRTNTPGPFCGWSASKLAIDKRAQIAPWTLHDLRRTYRTIHARIGTPPHIAERLVNHISSRSEVEAIYDRHTYADEMRAAVDRFEEWFAALIK
jgi:integrase